MFRLAGFAFMLAVLVGGSVLLGRYVKAAEDRGREELALDCGPAALLALGAVEGHVLDYDRLAARLPQRRYGHSMKELRDVSRSFGLKLEGLHVGKKTALIDRPMLIFVKDKAAKIEHFLVVRPVGHTGSLVQLIDSNGPPRVIDKADLVRSSQWTGVALVPVRTNWSTVVGASLVGGAILLFVAWWIFDRRFCDPDRPHSRTVRSSLGA